MAKCNGLLTLHVGYKLSGRCDSKVAKEPRSIEHASSASLEVRLKPIPVGHSGDRKHNVAIKSNLTILKNQMKKYLVIYEIKHTLKLKMPES